MLRVVLTWIVILNLSSAPLYNAIVVVKDEAIEVGTIEVGKSVKVETPNKNSYRVIFTLGQEREEWLGTEIVKCDTLRIDDNTNTFEVEIFGE